MLHVIDGIVKEIALQNNDFYLAERSDDVKKMLDRMYIELQLALLLLAGAGIQGFTEWQSANMLHQTNKLKNRHFCCVTPVQMWTPSRQRFFSRNCKFVCYVTATLVGHGSNQSYWHYCSFYLSKTWIPSYLWKHLQIHFFACLR